MSLSEVDRFTAVDVDAHFVEPPSMWSDYLSTEHQDAAPRAVLDNQGRRRVVLANQLLPYVPFHEVHNTGDTREGTPENAGSDPSVRLQVMDLEGIEKMVMYPTRGLHFAFIDDKDSCVALCQAYNNWAADVCSTSPERLLAHAVVPQRWVSETRLEIERALGELGLRGVFMRPNPVGRSLDDPTWDPIWSLLEEFDAPLGLHEGTGRYVPQLGIDRTDNLMFQHMMTTPFEHMAAMLSLIGGGVLEHHPGLRVAFLEAGCGWVPYWLERMEHHVDEFTSGIPLDLRPTDYFKRQCLVSTDSDEGAVVPAFVSCLGSDNLAWSTDFPHPDHEWRGMVRRMMEREDLDGAAKENILCASAARFYKM